MDTSHLSVVDQKLPMEQLEWLQGRIQHHHQAILVLQVWEIQVLLVTMKISDLQLPE